MTRLWVLVVVVAGCSTASRSDEGTDASVGRADAGLVGDSPSTGTRTIKVLTMNLKTALPSDSTFAQRTQLVASLITTEQPDLVALQEVTETSSMQNRGEALAAMTGYSFRFKKTHELLVGNEGIGILARGQITWSGNADLPHTELGLLHRAVLGARVTLPGDTMPSVVELYATHFTVAGSTDDRADQAATALEFARSNHQAGVPAFFAGDLNAEPSELAMKMLRGAASYDGVTGDLVDAWPTGGTGNGFTIPSDAPDRRIDYIYALPQSMTPSSCKTVLVDQIGGVYASDHLGVLCSFAH